MSVCLIFSLPLVLIKRVLWLKGMYAVWICYCRKLKITLLRMCSNHVYPALLDWKTMTHAQSLALIQNIKIETLVTFLHFKTRCPREPLDCKWKKKENENCTSIYQSYGCICDINIHLYYLKFKGLYINLRIYQFINIHLNIINTFDWSE